ncbi:glycoside hydrolase [Clostridium fermenticellae]|uniref:Glycoside hydrolase n=1 Tax=Clostridium fermenticellae TaxID=2068654 RepID=A0A386H0F2_9CLOT|nr:C40 family peptidase [Clostridium fermenticellae]AYD39115.1 glycoside hydrolase [Clostridium fermenticellae]
MNRRTVSLALTLTLALGISGNALAAPTSSSLSLKQVQEQRQDLETKTEQLDNQITQVMQQIKDNKDKIVKTSNDIKQVQADLNKAKNDIESQRKLFDQRVRAMYINGADSYLGVILDSQNLSDFITRVDNVKKIMGYDKQVINSLNSKKAAIENKKQLLCNENNKLISLKSDNEKKLVQLSSDKSQETKVLASLKQKETQLTPQENAMVASATNKVNQVKNNTANTTVSPSYSRGSGSSSSVSSNAVVAYASNFLGTPYQWGGNGPGSFDCSGFTCYVFAHFGVSLPRIASDQQSVGTAVSRDNLQPGDLVFFGSPAHHVGIYVGNGCYIHAPKTGDVVKISPLNRSDYSGARRVL